jgi:ketosteroid isomerase-like protein
MSHEHVEVARRVLDALGARDASALIDLSDPAVEWHSFFAVGEAQGMYRGHDGVRRFMNDLIDAFDVGFAEVDDALGVGDIAVLVGRIRYRGRESGMESATEAGWVFKFRSGKVLRFRAFTEPERALEVVGLLE